MPAFLHAADVHLDSPLLGLERREGAPAARIREAPRRALSNLVDLALEREVAFVVLAGDLYDGDWKDYRTGLYFCAQMSRLRQAGVPVFVAAGNHDAASEITRSLRPPDNVRFFDHRRPERVVREDLGVAVHGQGYGTREVFEDLAAGYPPPVPGLLNVGVLHTSLDGRAGHAPYAPTTADRLRSRGYAYWALGHVHHREVVSEDPWIVFPGNLQGRHVGETGPKGASLVTWRGDEVQGVEPLETDVLRWAVLAVDAGEARGGDDVVLLAREALARALLDAGGRPLAARVEVVGASRAHAALARDADRWTEGIRAAATDLGDAWVERVRWRTRPTANRDALRERDDAVGALVRALDAPDGDRDDLARFHEELEDLRQKLPPSVLALSDVPPRGDSAALLDALGDARELILGRLIEADEP